jgi:hypothetical protein
LEAQEWEHKDQNPGEWIELKYRDNNQALQLKASPFKAGMGIYKPPRVLIF